MAISDYSTTPASNTSLSGIDITGTTGKVKDGDNAIRRSGPGRPPSAHPS